ncbi:CRISPR-associated helicase [Nocardia nova SH22a]|uniref:CRISPR-associated helicase n=1 Tax=Nocardia nova SH22a TaxID=1415166 RepID=W5TGY8_9NOCA|nr:CRISPR-associated helicase Cas3' [Nocardia nova]AHH16506.1 CRISPR-associated helicase [Nocardia nova SH22a]
MADVRIDQFAGGYPWAKTDTEGISRAAGGPAWDPLVAHMLDVAAVVFELWDRYLSLSVRNRLAESFGDGNDEHARVMVAFLVALHDLGKASDCFLDQFGTGRAKRNGLDRERAVWEKMARAADLPLAEDMSRVHWARHEHITAAHLARILGCECFECGGTGTEYEDLHVVAMLLAGHHGHIPDKHTVDVAYGAAAPAVWGATHSELAALIADTLGVDLSQVKEKIRFARSASLTLFAGFVVLADWVASSQTWFHYRESASSIESCWEKSQSEAAAAVTALRLARWQPPALTWSDLWPGTEPRGFQQAVIDLLPNRGPALAIIESDTGSGKTRAALWCAYHLARTCGYTGLYMAMPTRAATNQIAVELRAFIAATLNDADSVNFAVVHGTAQATDIVHDLLDAARADGQELDDLSSSIEPGLIGDADPAGLGRVVLDPWYLRRCLGLVSPFGIGTVDQLVLAVQRSSHWFLRMLGLACKTVIIDEAHAYELYQQQLLESAVAWLADAGASVVVLSATLPTSVREALTNAWCRGHRTEVEDAGQSGPITMVDAAGRVRRGGPVETPPELHTVVTLDEDPGIAQLAARLVERVEHGGVAAVIRTRVSSAVDLHAAVVEQAKERGWPAEKNLPPKDIILLHGRMMPRDRLPIEQRLVKLTGLGTDRGQRNPQRPQRLIVIATQVIEQSLDVDFDWIVTDLAPIDLLIQRRGRLHRHQINDSLRAPQFATSRMSVLVRVHNQLPIVEPPDENNRRPGTLDALVYAPYTLAATWEALQSRRGHCSCERCAIDNSDAIHLVTPNDSATLIESVYGAEPRAAGELGQLLDRTWNQWKMALNTEQAEASARAVNPYKCNMTPIGVAELASGAGHGDGEEGGAAGIRSRSRLGDESFTAVLLYRQNDGTLTYDNAGSLLADLKSHNPTRSKRETEARRRQQSDILLNTISIPARWIGPRRIPKPETWRPVTEYGPFAKLHVVELNTDGKCINEPHKVVYSSTRGIEMR